MFSTWYWFPTLDTIGNYVIELKKRETINNLEEFEETVEICLRTPTWATEFVGIIKATPLQTLHADNSAVLPGKCGFTSLYNLETHSREETKIGYCSVIFETRGVDGFINSLDSTDWRKKGSRCDKFNKYLGTALNIWKTRGNLSKCVMSSDCVKKFTDIVQFRLENIGIHYGLGVPEYFLLSFAIICLYDMDTKIYEDFSVSLDPLFMNALKIAIEKIKSGKQDVLKILTEGETESFVKSFELTLQNDEWRSTWATDFLKIINIPLQAVFENSSVLARKCFFTIDNGSENQLEAETKDSYCNDIFKVWGEDGLIGSLNLRDNDEGYQCWCNFKNSIDKQLRIWKIPGNRDKFGMFPDFLNALQQLEELCRKAIKFSFEEDVSEYFRICFAVISIFDLDEDIFNELDVHLDPFFEKALGIISQKAELSKSNVFEMLVKSETESRVNEFKLKVENCRSKPIWAAEFLQIINIRLQAFVRILFSRSTISQLNYVILRSYLEYTPFS